MNLIKYTSDVGAQAKIKTKTAAPGHVINTNLADALKILVARYSTLTIYFRKLADASKKAGKPVPLEGMRLYNAAVADYLKSGNALFEILVKKKLHVEQVVMRDGKPVQDPRRPGFVRTITVDAPLRPPIFVAKGVAYPSIAGDDMGGVVKWQDVAVVGIGAVGLAAATFLSAGTLPIILLIIGVGGYMAVRIIQEIAIAWRGPSADVIGNLDAFTKTHDALYQGYIKSGMAPKEAADRATKETKEAMEQANKPPGQAGPGFILPLLVVLGGGFAAVKLLGGKGQAAA